MLDWQEDDDEEAEAVLRALEDVRKIEHQDAIEQQRRERGVQVRILSHSLSRARIWGANRASEREKAKAW